jgi:hypothetical protein
VFFQAAEKALGHLVTSRKWQLVTDKATCIRIEIAPFAHIDVPLYAIPDVEFETLQKAAAARGHLDCSAAVIGGEPDTDTWLNLPDDVVLLAHREHDWMKSDPRPIKDWFLGQVALHGEQFRRVVRYLKAFRDWQWPSGGPSSILLMVAAAPVFGRRHGRDDLALLDVVSSLPRMLRGGVSNPKDPEESLTKRLGPAKVEEAARKFETLEHVLRRALDSEPDEACTAVGAQFGPRFPNEPERVEQVSVAETVSAAPAAAVASPLVGRTRAG